MIILGLAVLVWIGIELGRAWLLVKASNERQDI